MYKLFAFQHDIEYPNTLNGAICDEKFRRNAVLGDELEGAGAAIGETLRQFFALPKDDQIRCATDEAMWAVDDCAAEIKKAYRKRRDPGDCTAYFTAATGRCSLKRRRRRRRRWGI